jgi:hypothetical protein
MAIKRNAEGKIIRKRFTMERIEAAREDMAGFCIACGAEKDGCEPDARRYACDDCGLPAVYGAETVALMGLIR